MEPNSSLSSSLYHYQAEVVREVATGYWILKVDVGFKLEVTKLFCCPHELIVGDRVWVQSNLIEDDVAQYEIDVVSQPAKGFYHYPAYCHWVIDGDTIITDIDLGFGLKARNERIRLAHINTPELEENEGLEALGWMRSRAENRQLYLQTVRSKDLGLKREKYGRYLAFVFDGNENLNTSLVTQGLAAPFMVRNRK